MLIEEAKWIGKELLEISEPGFKVLNIGSSSEEYRTKVQPHIEKFIFRPLKENNIKVIHTDIVNEQGVDIVGDLTSPEFIIQLEKNKYDLIICSNLLEHLKEKQLIVDAILEILPKASKAIITVPYNYPYHLDPIDTMYRPNTNELHQLFKNTELLKEEILIGKSVNKNTISINYWQKLKITPLILFKLLVRVLFPFYKTKVWLYTFLSLKNMFSPFSVSCILIKKQND
jgi:SAM-dependent methyltransferase